MRRPTVIDVIAVTAISAAATTAVWGGWVELGHRCGYGLVRPMPGTPWSDAQVDLAITLPLCVETLGAYALYCWLSPRRSTTDRARRLARWVSVGALSLGVIGQGSYHLLDAMGRSSAPWQLTMIVSIIPVIALAAITTLVHLRLEDGAGQVIDQAITDHHAIGQEIGQGDDHQLITDQAIDRSPIAPVVEHVDQAITDHRDQAIDHPMPIGPVIDRSDRVIDRPITDHRPVSGAEAEWSATIVDLIDRSAGIPRMPRGLIYDRLRKQIRTDPSPITMRRWAQKYRLAKMSGTNLGYAPVKHDSMRILLDNDTDHRGMKMRAR